jgi:hypothetical protein
VHCLHTTGPASALVRLVKFTLLLLLQHTPRAQSDTPTRTCLPACPRRVRHLSLLRLVAPPAVVRTQNRSQKRCCCLHALTLPRFFPFFPRTHTSAPLCYFGGREVAKDLSDRVCTKCLVRIDRQGSIKEQPLNVPDINPVTGQLNSAYGWVKPGAAPQPGGVPPAAWVQQQRESDVDTSKTD